MVGTATTSTEIQLMEIAEKSVGVVVLILHKVYFN
jgi:hypothetical protein